MPDSLRPMRLAMPASRAKIVRQRNEAAASYGQIHAAAPLAGDPDFLRRDDPVLPDRASAPGDPINLITWTPDADPETAEKMRRQLGLDQPPLAQYLYWLVGNDWTMLDIDGDGVGETPGDRYGLLRGDLGESIKQKKPVMALIGHRVPATLRLGVAALALGYMIGVLLGVLAAVFHRTWIDQVIRIISVMGNAVPAFWLGCC